MSKSAQTPASGSPRNKPSTRSSLRHSLGLAGKAFADVINKDSSRDPDKSARKLKDTRRLSGIALKPAAPRTSMGDTKHAPQALKRVTTPDSKTITRRRVSAGLGRASMDDQPTKGVDSVGRVATLRPRTAGSALPKYRPRSVAIESTKSPSPSPTVGTRRRFSSSEDEKEERLAQKKADAVVSPSERGARPISPLPQRAALKGNLSNTVHATPPATPTRIKAPSSTKSSPSRPAKQAKTVPTISVAASSIPRPGSSTSSSTSSPSRRSPKTPSIKSIAASRRVAQEKGSRASPSPHLSVNDSPLSRHSRNASKSETPTPSPRRVGNMSHISEGNSGDEDSDAEDVALLLAPVASLGAPTPAMPKIQSTRTRKRLPPQTPTRSNFLPSRANMSYLSPLPPDAEASSSSLRPLNARGEKQARGSILSWEQVASEASLTLGEEEIDTLISDFPAPFRPGAVSPTPSNSGHFDIPESPCLSALSSPGGYGSISQVLLPDVTPSPAVNHHQSSRYDMDASDIPVVDAAIVTLLRLQLAAAENTAKERLLQMQIMEEEIHNLKEARSRDAQELTSKIAYMEEQMYSSLEIRERAEEQRSVYTVSLEDQLRIAHAQRDQSVEAAILRGQEIAHAEQEAALEVQRDSAEVACSARVAVSEWASVHELAEMELDVVREEREVLSLLLAELEQLSQSVL
ncbi:hypothetical protein DXG03_006198 [Asterophora parasitica]|uniref:Uncharacterized protein n=1 Tax=Asterophora parasitica TaxID=117018 RepID=A0A9P7KGX2_9AGAR|nr:hypothetical protein DXG03_006198 [Asterophora parasitica]